VLFILQFSIFFLYLLTVLNTLSTAIDDALVGGLNDKKVEFGSRGKQHFQDIINFPIKKILGSG
jgi:hypothetical protein